MSLAVSMVRQMNRSSGDIYGGWCMVDSMEKTTLYLPPDLQRELREAANRAGRSQADVIRDAIRRYLEDVPRPKPRSFGAGEDAELTGRASEDWLRERWGDERTRPDGG